MAQTSFYRATFDVAPVGMLVVDARGAMVDVNHQLERLFAYTRDELVGRPVELLVDGLADSHRAQRERYLAQPEARPMGAGRDLFGRHRDGHRVPIEIGLTPLRHDSELLVVASVVDLTERKRGEALLEASLREKETLLRELHHRSKNNLALIASLLDLARGQTGPDVLSECRDRINAIALVHEKLYQAETFSRIALREYVTTLGEQVSYAWQRSPVTLSLAIDDLGLPLDTAIPCGLVLNELLTNAYKHAFPDGRPGHIAIEVHRDGAWLTLAVADDGVGLPTSAGPGRMGLELVHALARQLRATLSFERAPGTRVTLRFQGGDA